MRALTCYLADEPAMVAFGQLLGQACQEQGTLFLQGELGRGKTTLSRGVLEAFGHRGAVKSPTYTLVEPYDFGNRLVYHFDLYRLGDPEELEYLGIRDYFEAAAVRLIEWPERGEGVLPDPDVRIQLALALPGREVRCEAVTARGEQILSVLGALVAGPEAESQGVVAR